MRLMEYPRKWNRSRTLGLEGHPSIPMPARCPFENWDGLASPRSEFDRIRKLALASAVASTLALMPVAAQAQNPQGGAARSQCHWAGAIKH
jgi:hypothetical protein